MKYDGSEQLCTVAAFRPAKQNPKSMPTKTMRYRLTLQRYCFLFVQFPKLDDFQMARINVIRQVNNLAWNKLSVSNTFHISICLITKILSHFLINSLKIH